MWLYVPGISATSPSALAAEDSISASSWQCQMLAQSCWWRGKPSPSPLWSKRCNALFWLRRLSGRMPPPSMAGPGVASWVASLAASHASPIPSRAAEAADTIPETSGRTPGGSSPRRAPGGCSSRTSLACSPRPRDSAPAPTASAEIYRDWVMRLRADYSARLRSARAMSASACSSSAWPTARASTAMSALGNPDRAKDPSNSRLEDTVALWPTPKSSDPTSGADRTRRDTGAPQSALPTAVALWPTATATATARDHRSVEAGPSTHARNSRPLSEVVGLWSTPRATDGEKGGPNQAFGAGGTPLPSMAAQWATPTSLSFATSHQPGNSRNQNINMALAYSLLDPETSPDGASSSRPRRTLNPLFVEWLMGWPPGWTEIAISGPGSSACGSLETGLYRWKQRMRSELSRIGSPTEASARQLSLFG